jgi:hypothetical protein
MMTWYSYFESDAKEGGSPEENDDDVCSEYYEKAMINQKTDPKWTNPNKNLKQNQINTEKKN